MHFFSVFKYTLVALVLFAGVPFMSQAATRTLTSGTSGSDVRLLQQTLAIRGYLSATPTGYFGPATLAAVKKFQCEKNIVCSGSSFGVVGPKTQAALSGGATTPSTSAATGMATPGFEVGGWIPYWRSATGTADVLPNLSKLTEISPFVLTLKNDGTLFDAGGLDKEPWVSFIAAAKAQKVRVIPTVMSGSGDAIHTLLSDTKKRAALEDEIVAFVKNNNFDGIDIDFEGKKAETNPYFAAFLKELYKKMGNKWVYCTLEARTPISSRYTSTPPADAGVYANDFVAINKYCDRVQIMAYDQGTIDLLLNKSRAAPYIPVSDPAWVEKVLELTAQTIDKKKLILGIATYGYEYSVTPLSEYGYRYDREWAFNPGYATQLAAQLGIVPVRNAAGELSFIYKSTTVTDKAVALASKPGTVAIDALSNNVAPASAVYSQQTIAGSIQPPFNILWWSDAQAIADKIALAKKMGIRGVALFKLDGGQDPGLWNVLPRMR